MKLVSRSRMMGDRFCLLKPEDWKATWIGRDGPDEQESSPLRDARWIWLEGGAASSAPAEPRYFRRTFTLPAGRAIKKAVCRMTADDGFSLLVNLAENYPMMKRWVEFLGKRLDPDFIYRKGCFGDWVDAYSMDGKTSDHGATSRELLWTAYVCYNCRLAAQTADLVEHPKDAAHFRATAEKVGAAFNRTFFDPKSNTYASETQTSYVLPLAFGLVPPEHRQAVIDNLGA